MKSAHLVVSTILFSRQHPPENILVPVTLTNEKMKLIGVVPHLQVEIDGKKHWVMSVLIVRQSGPCPKCGHAMTLMKCGKGFRCGTFGNKFVKDKVTDKFRWTVCDGLVWNDADEKH